MRMPPRANSVGGRGGVRLLGSSSTSIVHTLQIKVINNSIWAISYCCGTFQHTLHHQTGVHLSSQSSSTTSSHSWLGMLMHSVVGTIAHTWLESGIGTLMRMISMLVKGYVCWCFITSRGTSSQVSSGTKVHSSLSISLQSSFSSVSQTWNGESLKANPITRLTAQVLTSWPGTHTSLATVSHFLAGTILHSSTGTSLHSSTATFSQTVRGSTTSISSQVSSGTVSHWSTRTVWHFCSGTSWHCSRTIFSHFSLGTNEQTSSGTLAHFCVGTFEQLSLVTSWQTSWGTVLHTCFGTCTNRNLFYHNSNDSMHHPFHTIYKIFNLHSYLHPKQETAPARKLQSRPPCILVMEHLRTAP